MQCPNCQHEIRPGQLYCDNCGRDLGALQPAETASPADPINTPDPALPPEANPPVDEDGGGNTVVPPPANPVATKTQLIIKDGGATYDLPAGRETVVGRIDPLDGIYPDIDLTPHDPAVGVSRRHATFHEQGGQWFLKDHQSTNYTVVNRQRVNPDQDYLLTDGDEIRFGRVVATFRLRLDT